MKAEKSIESKAMKLHSTKEMIGINQAWRIETEEEITFFVSPAVYTLLEDESVAQQVMNDISCKDINYAVKEMLEAKAELRRYLVAPAQVLSAR